MTCISDQKIKKDMVIYSLGITLALTLLRIDPYNYKLIQTDTHLVKFKNTL